MDKSTKDSLLDEILEARRVCFDLDMRCIKDKKCPDCILETTWAITKLFDKLTKQCIYDYKDRA